MSQIDLSDIDLNTLVALDVLLEERHVTKSADRLGLSQSAMSRNLARLRELFSDPLLVRTASGYVRTSRGDELAVALRPILTDIQAMFASRTFDPSLATGTFRIVALDYPEVALLPPLMKNLRAIAPALKVEIGHKSILSIDEIIDGTADVSIGLMPRSLPKHCSVQELYRDEYVCVMHKSHPLAGTALTLEDYVRFPHSVVHTGKTPGSFVDTLLAERGLSRQIVKHSPHFVASVLSIRDTDLLQTAPRRLVLPLLEAAELEMHELPFELEPVVVSQLWHARNSFDPLHKWFREQIKLAAHEAPG